MAIQISKTCSYSKLGFAGSAGFENALNQTKTAGTCKLLTHKDKDMTTAQYRRNQKVKVIGSWITGHIADIELCEYSDKYLYTVIGYFPGHSGKWYEDEIEVTTK